MHTDVHMQFSRVCTLHTCVLLLSLPLSPPSSCERQQMCPQLCSVEGLQSPEVRIKAFRG